jgi:hypothetical protein
MKQSKQGLLRLITAFTLIAVVGFCYGNCWIQYNPTCVPDGAQVGTHHFNGCQGVSPYDTQLWAHGNWTWDFAYYNGEGSGWDTIRPAIANCCGTAKAWNYCWNSYEFFPNTCVANPGYTHLVDMDSCP